MHKLDDLQKLRAFAIIMVLFGHAGLAFPNFLMHGYTGVSLFFVISGYVVTLSIIRRLPDSADGAAGNTAFLRDFYIRRIFRILPVAAFWVLASIVIVEGARRLGGVAIPWTVAWPTEVKWLLSGAYNYFFASRHMPAMFGHYWSLAVEMHFYLLLPILLLAVRSRRALVAACALGVVLVAAVLRPLTSALTAGFVTHAQADALLMGVLICLLAVSERRLPLVDRIEAGLPQWAKNVVFFALVGTLLWLPSALDGVWQPVAKYPLYTALASLIVFLAQRERGWVLGGLPKVGRFFSYLGDRSFSLYVCHPIVWVVLYRLLFNRLAPGLPAWVTGSGWGIAVQFGIMFLGALGASELSYRFVETPYIEYGKSLIRSLRERAPKVVPAPGVMETPEEAAEPAAS